MKSFFRFAIAIMFFITLMGSVVLAQDLQNNRYEIVVYWSAADGCFLAEVPELPNLITDGTSRQEALRIRPALHAWSSQLRRETMAA